MDESDMSRKGFIDEDILDLINKINKNPNYCTTSSCSGRIVLIDLRARLKSENEWLLSKHSPITLEDFDEAITEKEVKGVLWFKQEPVILHVMCRDVSSVKKFILLSQRAGFKQIGVISLPRNIVEIIGSESMSLPVYSEKLLINDDYKKFIVDEANRKLLVAKSAIEKMYSLFEEVCSD